MIRVERFLVDTAVWIEHLRKGDEALADALNRGRVLVHPFVIGELACGRLPDRARMLEWLRNLPSAPVATQEEVLAFTERHGLMGRGIGYIDVHLLAAAALAGVRLWTYDARLANVAAGLGLA